MADIGYTRVSTRGQNPASNVAQLEAAGCIKVFVDHGYSSRLEERPEWLRCMDQLRAGDRLVIPALDRIAGSEVIAINVIRSLAAREVKLHSLAEPWLDIDQSNAIGQAVVSIMATLAQLRVEQIRENTRRGLDHARAQGRVGGRPSVMTPERVEIARQMRQSTKPPMSYEKIAQALSVGSSSVKRALSNDVPTQ